jgi:hypothetical protein
VSDLVIRAEESDESSKTSESIRIGAVVDVPDVPRVHALPFDPDSASRSSFGVMPTGDTHLLSIEIVFIYSVENNILLL